MTRARGLLVFGDLGKKGLAVLDAALALNGHPLEIARNGLLDGVACYPEMLNAIQASKILTLVNDPFPLVRDKVVIFLAYAKLASLDSAIAILDEPLKSEHRAGFDTLVAEPPDVQRLFDEAVARDDTWAMYAFASIDRLARKALLTPVPEYAGDEYVPAGVIHHVKMLNKRRDRTRQR
jgi:hypothetical protein